MALLERVSTLVRANLNDLIDRAEHPEKMIKQVMLDMENQLMQVKTQVAIAIADEHLLLKKQKENEEKAVEWSRKAEIAVDKKQDDLARAAIDRELTCRQMGEGFAQQVADQKQQVEVLKSALRKLEQKLQEANAKSELLMAQHRRSRALGKASDARMAVGGGSAVATLDRMKNKVSRSEALSQAKSELAGDNLDDRLAALGKEDEIEKLLTDLKARRGSGVKLWILLFAAHLAMAQGGPGAEGNWFGTLDVGAAKLRLNLKVVKGPDGALSAKMDSLDQGANDLPVSMIRQSGASVECEMKQIGGFYQGTMKPDGSELAGTWKQGGASFPLTFRRVDKVTELARPQASRKPFTYTEEEVTYENKAGGSKLAGTLTTPQGNGPFPAVLLITGSGPQDRDESLMGHKPFFVLSDYLTRNGIAVLRVDDRGVGRSTGETKMATSEDFAGDVLAGVEFLKTRGPKIDPKRIGLIGHSEGGVIAPMVAIRSKDVAFLVMMAGTGVPGDQVLYEQGAAIAKAMGGTPAAIAENRTLQEQIMVISKAEADPAARQARLNELKTKLNLPNQARVDVQFQMAATPWFRYFLMYDPAPTLKKVTCPVLAINGELDLQVLPDQNLPAIEQALKAGGNRDVTVIKLPRLNHLFQTAKTGSPAEYGAIEETLAPLALETIGGWILKHTAR